jgi:hypothetical protein
VAHNPYIVIGTGRSGSSTVARVLRNKMDVFMGYRFREPDDRNPSGYWEDVDICSPNWKFLNGKITYGEWIEAIFSTVNDRVNMGIPWGFKDPDATHFLGLYLSFFKKPKIIRCVRKKELVVPSLMRCFGHTEAEASDIVDMKEMILDNILSEKSYLSIHFDEQKKTDDKIMNEIRGKFNNA